MASVAADYGAFMKLMLNDTELKTVMNIPIADQTNFSKLMSTYMVETYTSDVITTTAICRLLIHSAPILPTNNSSVNKDSLVIEVYVPNGSSTANLDRMPGFQRRSNQIVDRLLKLFQNKVINNRKLRLVARHELASSVAGYARIYIQFEYKKICA